MTRPGSTLNAPRIPRRTWIGIVLAGTVVRALFGMATHTWDRAPDQLAWGIGLEDLVLNGTLDYKRLIHYPHEGGSFLLSLIALFFRPLSAWMPPLSWAALLVDAFARYVQIRVADRLFGHTTALWFSAWTVFATPLMLPWATMDFGLHALISFAPFVLVAWACEGRRPTWQQGLLAGALAALAYEVWIIVAAYVLWTLFSADGLRAKLLRVVQYVLFSVLGFLPHLGARLFLDSGFQLERISGLSVRGLETQPVQWTGLPGKAFAVLFSDLPASFLLARTDHPAARVITWVILALIVVGAWRAWNATAQARSPLRFMVWCVLLFLLALIVPSFFVHEEQGGGALYFRYFAFMAPLLVLIMIEGVGHAGRWKLAYRSAWIGLCIAGALTYMRGTTSAPPNMRATGWVLARKYGHEPATLLRMVQQVPAAQRPDVLFGYGWGTAAALFDRKGPEDHVALKTFDALWSAYPDTLRSLVADGVRQAFAPGITPVLNDSLEEPVFARLSP